MLIKLHQFLDYLYSRHVRVCRIKHIFVFVNSVIMNNQNKNTDLEALIADVSLDEIIRIKLHAIEKKKAALDSEEDQLRSLTAQAPQAAKKAGRPKKNIVNEPLQNYSGNQSTLIFDLFNQNPNGLTNYEIQQITGFELRSIRDCVSRMVRAEKLRSEKTGNTLEKRYFLIK